MRGLFYFAYSFSMDIQTLYSVFQKTPTVNTDSRNIQKNDLFFALKGPSFNGNFYAEDALKKGAAAAVIDDEKFKKGEKYILVPDVLVALQQLAAYHRDQLNIPVIAIAGSNGKTTTKELLKEILKTTFETYATPGNLNNEIGVPLTLLKLTSKTQIAVIELGARHKNDISFLCNICHPTHGIITNTGKDHLETFKTLENTRKTNAELFEYLSAKGGTAFVNMDDHDLINESQIVKNRITYGSNKNADLQGKIISSFPFLTVEFHAANEKTTIESKLTGNYNFQNIMAAAAIGKNLGVTNQKIKNAIENYIPSNNRSQLLQKNSNTFIMDAYNANPTSMMEALKNFASVPAAKKIAVLGDMLELGEASLQEHLEVVNFLKTQNFQQIILVGNEFSNVKNEMNCLHFNDTAAAKKWFQNEHFTCTTFLFKGSRGIGLEKILD